MESAPVSTGEEKCIIYDENIEPRSIYAHPIYLDGLFYWKSVNFYQDESPKATLLCFLL